MFYNYKNKVSVFLITILIFLCYLVYLENSRGDVDGTKEDNNGTEAERTLNSAPFDIDKLSESVVREQQVKAFNATSLQLGVGDIESPVSYRPEFISPLEWEVLRRVSGNEEDPEKSLANYINHVRFAKQEELWEQLVETNEVGRRHSMAEQLLANIPSRVKNNNISVHHAQRLQMKLLSDLVEDPEKRRSRISEEADKIGVIFRVEKIVSVLGG